MKEIFEQPISVYRTMIVEKTFDGWSAEVVGLDGTRVTEHRYKEAAIDASVEMAKTLLGLYHSKS